MGDRRGLNMSSISHLIGPGTVTTDTVAVVEFNYRLTGQESPISGDDLAVARAVHLRPRRRCKTHAHCRAYNRELKGKWS